MKRAKVISESGGQALVAFRCPGCGHAHTINTNVWRWDEDLERPTFSPSVLVRGNQWPKDEFPEHYKPAHAQVAPGSVTVCHSFVTDGRIQFLGDCTHALAGQTVDLPPWQDIRRVTREPKGGPTMTDLRDLPALDDTADADELAGDPVTAEHDLDPATFTEETDDE